VPDIRFGDSSLINAIPVIIALEQGYTGMINDQYIGKGFVLAPETISGNMRNDGLDNSIVKKLPYSDPNNKEVESVQFDLRVSEWERYKDMQTHMIADAVGLSASSLSSHLNGGAIKTATEVSSEQDRTANTVENKRALATPAINSILNTVCEYYGVRGKVGIRFSKAGLTNLQNLTSQTVQKYNAGLTSLKDAVSDLNPDANKAQVDQKVSDILEDKKQKDDNFLSEIGALDRMVPEI